MTKNKMIKKLFAAAMVVAMAFSMAACGGNETTSGTGGSSADANIPGTYTPELLDESKIYYADIDIKDYGVITVKLNQAEAPVSCANFVALANDGFYDGLTFHRIMSGFMMQDGDPEGTGMGGSENNIVGEFAQNGYENNISHKRGVISMARANDPNSASSQFFICHADSEFLDGQYAAFGEVTEGLDVVDAVCEKAQPTDDNGTIPAEEQPVMTSVKIRTE
ncbi:MAG: peptidylprolyl isomerase [Firmicutes bacterium]|nr:peptidylprolyl isomerase [Bacillota bacterium]